MYMYTLKLDVLELKEINRTMGKFLPRRISPKLPCPIFLPTLKFGPTIRTPELLEPGWPGVLDVCMLLPLVLRLLWSSLFSYSGLFCILIKSKHTHASLLNVIYKY